MTSVWFQPDLLTTYKEKIQVADHSPECKILGGNEWGNFLDLDLIAQDAVLSCRHRSHTSVKFIFKSFSDAPRSKRIQKGKLF